MSDAEHMAYHAGQRRMLQAVEDTLYEQLRPFVRDLDEDVQRKIHRAIQSATAIVRADYERRR